MLHLVPCVNASRPPCNFHGPHIFPDLRSSALQGYEVLKHMHGIPEHGNPPPVIRLYVDLNLQTLVSADIVSGTNGAANSESASSPSVPLPAAVSTSACV